MKLKLSSHRLGIIACDVDRSNEAVVGGASPPTTPATSLSVGPSSWGADVVRVEATCSLRAMINWSHRGSRNDAVESRESSLSMMMTPSTGASSPAGADVVCVEMTLSHVAMLLLAWALTS